MSLNIKPTRVSTDRPLRPVAMGTALVLITYVTPIATIPDTAADLGAGAVARAWILSSMSVGLAAALLASGVLGDRHGRRRLYLAGLVTMSAGALVCAVSVEPVLFIVARIVEGIGGAAVLACGLAALAHRFPAGPERIHATSVWAAGVGLGIALGSVLAAGLADLGGWRSAYVVSAALGLLLVLPSGRSIVESSAQAPRRVDLRGLLLLVAAMSLAVSALTQGRNGVTAPTLVLAVLALGALVLFLVVERRVAEPLIEPALLLSPRFRAATGGSLALGAATIAMVSFTPTLVQLGMGRGVWAASIPVLAWSGTSVVASMLVRRVPHPMAGPRPVALFLVVVAVGLACAGGLQPDSSVWRLVGPMVIAGVGTGVLNALLGREAIASVPADAAAMGSGANNTARYLGAACGITLFVTVATHAGDSLVDGWNTAVWVAVAITVVGAALIGLAGRRTPSRP